MGKRKVKRSVELRHNKRLKEEDAKLNPSIFGRANNDDVDDVDVEEGYFAEEGESRNNKKSNQWDEEEQDYELKPRVLGKHYGDTEEGLIEGLPIRKADGTIHRNLIKEERKQTGDQQEDDEDEDADSDKDNENDRESETKENNDVFDEELDASYKGLTPYQRFVKTQEDIATLAEDLMENPEENIINLARLRKMTTSKNENTVKLAILALVPVFKSIAPGYRIRQLSDTEKREKVSRDIAKLRFFEENLVKYYKQYLDLLLRKSRFFSTSPKASEFDISLARLASNAACELATSLRFFNFREDLITILVRRVVKIPSGEEDFKAFTKCVNALEELIKDDFSAGDISFDVSRIISKSLRKREYKIDESVVNIFLSLSILSDYDPNGMALAREEAPKLKKKDRVYLSKKERKQRKENKKIEEEMRVAEQAVSAEQREKYQAQILKIVLTLYLDILRVRPEKLMAPVLEGLAKFGHMVNLDLLGDFLEVLREVADDIINENINNNTLSNNQVRQVLLCIVTAFALIANFPSKKIQVDLNKFSEYLYTLLPLLSFDTDVELSHKSLRLIDPSSNSMAPVKPSVNVSTKSELLLRALNSLFFLSRTGSKTLAIAFTKRLYLSALYLPEKTSITILKFIDKLFIKYPELAGLYSTEDRINNGTYNAEVNEVSRANASVTTLWENVLLDKHYSQTVVMGSRHLTKKTK